jgi:hypothetical protein
MIRFWTLWREKEKDIDCTCLVILKKVTWGRMKEMEYDTLGCLVATIYPRFVL